MKNLTEFEKVIKKNKIDSALVQWNNNVIVEYYRNGKMKDKQHKIYSVTKSFLSALIGIAIDKEYIKNVQTPIIRYFPEIHKDDGKDRITIEHLLTMTSGLHWPGNGSMIPSKNWLNFVLQQDIIHPPGKEMVYSCGSSHLLSAIIQKTTGLNLEEFAKKNLFTPLGITDYKWNRDAQGVAIGGFGLTMRTDDMLKFGTLYANKGKWKSKQIVSSQWIEESTSPKIKSDGNYSYAFHWWNLTTENQSTKVYFAYGREGQFIVIAPDYQLIMVLTSSLKEEELSPLNYFAEYLMPNISNSLF